jgi:2-hydroxycyclohexanecarboxyl-CoA dehydrogenase
MIDLSHRLAVVTGAGSGIGRAIASTLAAAGAHVAAADINAAGAETTAQAITAAGGTAAAFTFDITDRASVAALRADVEEALGRATILVNNVGWDIIQPFLENTPEYWQQIVDINLLGPVAVTAAFLAPIVEAGDPARIVNIASDAGRVGSSGEAVYAGAKGGVIAFTKSLARETARHGITVNCVCPGPTDTPLFRSQSQRMQEALERAIPMRRLGQPADVAGAVAFFASDLAGFVTGQVLSVSGGLTMAG